MEPVWISLITTYHALCPYVIHALFMRYHASSYAFLHAFMDIYASGSDMHVSICYCVAYISVCVLVHTFGLADFGGDSKF